MNKDVKVLDSQEVVMTFTYTGEEWQKAQDKEYAKLANNLTIKGFRKGHVPADMAKRYINPNDVVNDAINTLVNASYREVMQEGKYRPLSQPTLSVTKLDKDGMVAEVKFSLPPVVTLGEYKGLDVKEGKVSVTAKDVDAYIENLRNEHATMNVKEGEAKLGDTVIIDFKGFIDDSPFDGGEAKGYELKLGSNAFVPGFEDQLVGIKANESKSIEVKFPENYVEDLKGKLARFDVHCSDVKETVLPEVDADFIAELNFKDVKTVTDLKKYAKEQLKTQKETEVKNTRLNDLVTLAINNSDVKIGDGILEDEAREAIKRIQQQVEQNGLNMKDYLTINNLDDAKLLAQQKEEALKNLKAYLVIEEICAKENIVVDEKALEEYYDSLSKTYNIPLETVKNQLKANEANVIRNLRNSKFNEFMLNASPVKETKKVTKDEVKEEAPAAEEKKTVKKTATKKVKKAEKEDAPATEEKAAKKTTTKKATTKKVAKKETKEEK